MKKNLHVIQISGFRGILMAIFVVSCLIAGFVAFPALVLMYGWNLALNSFLPKINFVGGILLWIIVALTFYLTRKKKRLIVSFNAKEELSEDEMKVLMAKIQANAWQHPYMKNVNLNNLNNLKLQSKPDSPEMTVLPKKEIEKEVQNKNS